MFPTTAGPTSCAVAQAMGHKDTRMLERVYGRQTPEQLAALMARAMGLYGVPRAEVDTPRVTKPGAVRVEGWT
jgi:hypothetical protein